MADKKKKKKKKKKAGGRKFLIASVFNEIESFLNIWDYMGLAKWHGIYSVLEDMFLAGFS